MRLLLIALAGLWALAISAPASATEKDLTGFGIILIHGKGGSPGSLIGSLATALEQNGATVVMPAMAWQGSQGRPRAYAETYDQALQSIDQAVAQLKSGGAARIVVGGQSWEQTRRSATRPGADSISRQLLHWRQDTPRS